LSFCKGDAGLGHFIPVLILSMALTASKVSSGPVVTERTNVLRSPRTAYSFAMSPQHDKTHFTSHGIEHRQRSHGHILGAKSRFSDVGLWRICRKPLSFIVSRGSSLLCQSTGTQKTEAKECVRTYGDCEDVTR
jgi:hypothetical protein